MRRAGEVERVHVETAGGLGEREDRVGGIISRAEQARFLAGDRQEDHGPVGAAGAGLRLGERDQSGAAARIVHRAVADPVRAGLRADAEMVPMGGVEHIFVRAAAAGEDADHVARGSVAHRVVECDRGLEAGQLHGAEARLARGALQRIEIVAAGGEQAARGGVLQPAIHRGLVGAPIGGLHVELRAGPAVLDRRPAIGSGLGVVHDQGRGGALPGRFLELVGPAPIIGHRPAVERPLIALALPVGVVDQDDDRLPVHVDAGIIVPAHLRRVDPVADENEVAVVDCDMRLRAVGRADIVGAVGEIQIGVVGPRDMQHRAALERDLDQRHILVPAAVIARLEAGALEFMGEERDRAGLAVGARRAALKFVRGQGLGDALQRLQRDLRRGRGPAGAGRGAAGERGEGKESEREAEAHILLQRLRVAPLHWQPRRQCASIAR